MELQSSGSKAEVYCSVFGTYEQDSFCIKRSSSPPRCRWLQCVGNEQLPANEVFFGYVYVEFWSTMSVGSNLCQTDKKTDDHLQTYCRPGT